MSKHLQVVLYTGLVHRGRSASAVIHSLAAEKLLARFRYLGAREIPASRDDDRLVTYEFDTRSSAESGTWPVNESPTVALLILHGLNLYINDRDREGALGIAIVTEFERSTDCASATSERHSRSSVIWT